MIDTNLIERVKTAKITLSQPNSTQLLAIMALLIAVAEHINANEQIAEIAPFVIETDSLPAILRKQAE